MAGLCPPPPLHLLSLARVMYKISMKANPCNNVAEIGRRVKASESVWLDWKSVLEKLQSPEL